MPKPKVPTEPGLWWAALDDGEYVVEVVPILVSHFHGLKDFSEGLVYKLCDGTGRDGLVDGDITRPIVKPSWDIVLGSRTRATVSELRLTWIEPVRGPRKGPKVGDLTDLEPESA